LTGQKVRLIVQKVRLTGQKVRLIGQVRLTGQNKLIVHIYFCLRKYRAKNEHVLPLTFMHSKQLV
jgi:hypothetical protein